MYINWIGYHIWTNSDAINCTLFILGQTPGQLGQKMGQEGGQIKAEVAVVGEDNGPGSKTGFRSS